MWLFECMRNSPLLDDNARRNLLFIVRLLNVEILLDNVTVTFSRAS